MAPLMIEKVFLRVQELSNEINDLFDIDPLIEIRFTKGNEMDGSCIVTYQRTNMYIEVNVPRTLDPTPMNMKHIDVILLHEYCHYIEAINMNGSQRKLSSDFYEDFLEEKMKDEKKTWRQTKKLANALGLWDKNFYNTLQTFTYVSDLKYK